MIDISAAKDRTIDLRPILAQLFQFLGQEPYEGDLDYISQKEILKLRGYLLTQSSLAQPRKYTPISFHCPIHRHVQMSEANPFDLSLPRRLRGLPHTPLLFTQPC